MLLPWPTMPLDPARGAARVGVIGEGSPCVGTQKSPQCPVSVTLSCWSGPATGRFQPCSFTSGERPPVVARDPAGYVLTGPDSPPAAWPLDRPPTFLEISLPGVFAVGDVQHGSTKRVATSVGSGAMAIRLVHQYLQGRSADQAGS
jgi:hypothetical protein